jgi:hypothetical protein
MRFRNLSSDPTLLCIYGREVGGDNFVLAVLQTALFKNRRLKTAIIARKSVIKTGPKVMRQVVVEIIAIV